MGLPAHAYRHSPFEGEWVRATRSVGGTAKAPPRLTDDSHMLAYLHAWTRSIAEHARLHGYAIAGTEPPAVTSTPGLARVQNAHVSADAQLLAPNRQQTPPLMNQGREYMLASKFCSRSQTRIYRRLGHLGLVH
jgi:hypothetical protein